MVSGDPDHEEVSFTPRHYSSSNTHHAQHRHTGTLFFGTLSLLGKTSFKMETEGCQSPSAVNSTYVGLSTIVTHTNKSTHLSVRK